MTADQGDSILFRHRRKFGEHLLDLSTRCAKWEHAGDQHPLRDRAETREIIAVDTHEIARRAR